MPHYSDLQSWLGGMIEILALGLASDSNGFYS